MVSTNSGRHRLSVEPFTSIVVAYVVWHVFLDISYSWFVYPINGYYGYVYVYNPVRLAESYLWLLGILIISSRQLDRPSSILIHIFLLIGITPLLTYYAWSEVPRKDMILFMLGTVILIGVTRVMRPLTLGINIVGGRVAALGCAFLIVSTAATAMLLRGGVGSLNIDLTKVYEFRAAVTADLYRGYWAYLFSWAGAAVNMVLLAFALNRRAWLLALGFLCLQIFFFTATSNKIYLFLPILVLGSYFACGLRRPILFLCVSLIIFSVGLPLILFAFGFEMFADLLIRRSLFDSAHLWFIYLDFFYSHDFVWLSEGVLSFASEYPYGELGYGQVIGNYIGYPETNAATGGMASAYMHFGVVGVVSFALIAGIILRLLDGFCYLGMETSLVVAASIAPIRTMLLEGDFFTTLLTHGLLITLFLLILLSSEWPPEKRTAVSLDS